MGEKANIKAQGTGIWRGLSNQPSRPTKWITVQVTKYLHKVAGIKDKWMSLGDDFFVKIAPETFADETKFKEAILDNLKKRGKHAIDFMYYVTKTMAKGGLDDNLYTLQLDWAGEKGYEFGGEKFNRILVTHNLKANLTNIRAQHPVVEFTGTEKGLRAMLKSNYDNQQEMFDEYAKKVLAKGGNVTTMPIIARITTKPLTFTAYPEGKDIEMPSTNYDIVDITEMNGKKVYITNKWHKEYKQVPLVIIEDLVEKVEMLKAEGGLVTVYFEEVGGYDPTVIGRTPISKPMHHHTAVRWAKKYITENQDKMRTETGHHRVIVMNNKDEILNRWGAGGERVYAQGGELKEWEFVTEILKRDVDLGSANDFVKEKLKLPKEIEVSVLTKGNWKIQYEIQHELRNWGVKDVSIDIKRIWGTMEADWIKGEYPNEETEIEEVEFDTEDLDITQSFRQKGDEAKWLMKAELPKGCSPENPTRIVIDFERKEIEVSFVNESSEYAKGGKIYDITSVNQLENLIKENIGKKMIAEDFDKTYDALVPEKIVGYFRPSRKGYGIAVFPRSDSSSTKKRIGYEGRENVPMFRRLTIFLDGGKISGENSGKIAVKTPRKEYTIEVGDVSADEATKRVKAEYPNFTEFEYKRIQYKKRGKKGEFLTRIEPQDVLDSRWQKKKDRIRKLSDNIKSLRNNVTRDLSSDDEKTFLSALIVAIMDKTGERIGNDESADNGHYGVTGFRQKHVSVKGDNVEFDYVGKSGVKHEKMFSDEKIAKGLKRAMKDGKGLFVFTTSEGQRIRASQVNEYLSKFGVTAKDIRGYSANKWTLDKLKEVKPEDTDKKRKRQLNIVLKQVAAQVGHGAATLKKHYLMPEVVSEWIDNGKLFDITKAGYVMKKGGIPEKQLAVGVKVEHEHKDLYKKLKRRLLAQGVEMPMSEQEFYETIATAHLKEEKDYYKLLMKYVEKKKMVEGGSTNKNWIVRIYNDKNKVIDKFIIKDRTEHDATSEAEHEMDRRSQQQGYDDWTISELNKKAEGGEIDEDDDDKVDEDDDYELAKGGTRKLSEKYADKIARKKARLDISKEYNKPNNPFDDTVPSENWRKYALPEDTKIYFSDFAKGGTIITEDMVYEMREWVRGDASTNMEEARRWDLPKNIAKHFKISEKLAEDVVAKVIISNQNETEIYQWIMRTKQRFDECRSMKGMFAKGGKIDALDRYLMVDSIVHWFKFKKEEVEKWSDDKLIQWSNKTNKGVQKGMKFGKGGSPATGGGVSIKDGKIYLDKKEVGYISYTINSGVLEIHSIFVKDKNKGIGSLALKELVKVTKPKEIKGSALSKQSLRAIIKTFGTPSMMSSVFKEYDNVDDAMNYLPDSANTNKSGEVIGGEDDGIYFVIKNPKIKSSGGSMASGGQAGVREVVLTKNVNPRMKIIVQVQGSRIIDIVNEARVHFPFHKGQMFQMNVQEWARVNGYSMDGKNLDREEKIFGVRVSDIPQGHEWRMIYPNKFRAEGGEVGNRYKVEVIGQELIKDGGNKFRWVYDIDANSEAEAEKKAEELFQEGWKLSDLSFYSAKVIKNPTEEDKVVRQGKRVMEEGGTEAKEGMAVGGLTNEDIISKYNLHGKGIPVKFKNDQATYYTKNISPDRKSVFVTSMNGFVIKNKKIADIVSIENKPLRFAGGGKTQGDVTTSNGAKGGMLDGPSHDDGGIKTYVKANKDFVEVEGGESIINKHAMAMKEKVVCEGTPAGVASAVNQLAGNGVNFADNGTCKIVGLGDDGEVFVKLRK